jgi:SAM-dependent methyltransferase
VPSPPPPSVPPGAGGALASDPAQDLAHDLGAAGYTVDGVAAVLGPVAQAALHRESPLPAVRATARSSEPAATLARLWLLGRPVTRAALDAALPRCRTEGAVESGLVQAQGGQRDDEVRPLVDLRPYAADDAHWWLTSDIGELATRGPLAPDHVLGIGGASLTLARWVPRGPVSRALDVGTGCGVQAFHLARHAEQVVATDLSARCLAFTAFNVALNRERLGATRVDLRQGSLLEPVEGELFDLVVSNPPFVITPRAAGVPAYEYRDGGLPGDDLVRTLVGGLGDVLAPGGTAQLLGNWELHAGQTWAERVGSWLPGGLDAWVVQREVQDPAEYAETWARDGGHRPGGPAHSALIGAWLDDFEARGVEAVGFGVITVRRPLGTSPLLRRYDELTGPLGGGPGAPMGQVVVDVLAAHDWLAGHDDAALLQQRLVVAADVSEERFGRPGDDDPQVVLLRQGGGLQRGVRAGTALAGLVGACDGELVLGQIIGALAQLLEQPVEALTLELVPSVRGLVADGLLRPA